MSFLGGGSDLKDFYQNEPGTVFSTSINKYIYLSIHKYFNKDKQLLKYSKTEEVESLDQIKHPIIREVFKYYDIKNMDFNSTADVPSGTGVGSSSAFTSGLINLCSELKNLKLSNIDIAKQACYFEIDVLKEPIGKQDQYGCSVGGLKLITFNPDDSVKIKNLELSRNNLIKLEDNLFLYYTSLTRKASSILTVQKLNTSKNISTKNNLRRMSKMAIDLFSDFENGTIDNIGNYLDEAWKLKKELTNNISNSVIDDLYNKGIRSGADGGKLLGAGGGGFILFHVPKKNQEHFLFEMKDYRKFDFKFEFNGTQIIL